MLRRVLAVPKIVAAAVGNCGFSPSRPKASRILTQIVPSVRIDGVPDLPALGLSDWVDVCREARPSGSTVGSTLGAGHRYLTICRLLDLRDSKASADVLAKPAAWAALWAASMLRGGARPLKAIETDDATGAVKVPLALIGGSQDQVLLLSTMPRLGPRTPQVSGGGDFITTFCVKTMDWHSLRGTVQHNLICVDGMVYFAAVGGGSGGITPGVVNNALATAIMWRLVPDTLRVALQSSEAMDKLRSVANEFSQSNYEQLRAETAKGESWTSYLLGSASNFADLARAINALNAPTNLR